MDIHQGPWTTLNYSTYKHNDLVDENTFLTMSRRREELPDFERSRDLLPEPWWDGHASAIDCYWRAWQLAFANLREPTPESGFVANYIDTAFNDCIFMWDTCFILMFGRYGSRAFDFMGTLDNFYAKQHPDGFICREIGQPLGDDRFLRFDPTSTGPPIMAWTEWEHFLNFGDAGRLAKVFPVLMAYHRWMRDYRTWPDGGYWASGWACGMDNQPRLGRGVRHDVDLFYHGHMVWADTCMQQAFVAKLLVEMAKRTGRQEFVGELEAEIELLSRLVNEKLWDESTAFYYDLRSDGALNGVKSIGAYWALLAGVVDGDKQDRLVAHLDDEKRFKRPHRVPTLSADDQSYCVDGGYWRGSVWPPTNYMLLRGLTEIGRDSMAYEIGRNHLDMVVKVFEETGSVFENYAPETAAPGSPSRGDFVGWGGVPPICVLLEYVFGIRADVPHGKLVWDVRLTEAHGVKRYPFGLDGTVELACEARERADEKPRIAASANVPVKIQVRWDGGVEEIDAGPGRN